MTPALSTSAQGLRALRRPDADPALPLFAMPSAVSAPRPKTAGCAPVASGLSGALSVNAPADCPPPMPEAFVAANSTGIRDRKSAAPLVGIARLAASSPPAETRRKSAARPQYFHLPVRSMLNRCDSQRVPFEWTINPYRGCEFACRYCYARYTHEYMDLDGGADFERKIFVKENAGVFLARDLTRKYSFQPRGTSMGSSAPHIAIGTATDPYQPAENEFGVTRACLEELAKQEGLSLSITTKSNQVARDIDLLQRIAARSSLFLNITVTTTRPRLARLLEPRAPRPDLRLAAVKQLREAGLQTGVFASPLLPGITDREEDLDALAGAAKAAGAQWLCGGVLFLMPASRKQFMPFLREKFPRLARQYAEWYSKDGYAPEAYRRLISERAARVRGKYGLSSRPWDETARPAHYAQLSLGWGASASVPEATRPNSCAAG